MAVDLDPGLARIEVSLCIIRVQLLLLLNSFDHNPVIERTNLHGIPPLIKD